MEEDYQRKYLKYKAKYMRLEKDINMKGGNKVQVGGVNIEDAFKALNVIVDNKNIDKIALDEAYSLKEKLFGKDDNFTLTISYQPLGGKITNYEFVVSPDKVASLKKYFFKPQILGGLKGNLLYFKPDDVNKPYEEVKKSAMIFEVTNQNNQRFTVDFNHPMVGSNSIVLSLFENINKQVFKYDGSLVKGLNKPSISVKPLSPPAYTPQ